MCRHGHTLSITTWITFTALNLLGTDDKNAINLSNYGGARSKLPSKTNDARLFPFT